MTDGALSDLTIVDLSQGVAGAFCTKLLAGLGARVIKVEPPGGGPGRRIPPFVADTPGQEQSIPFLYLNTEKESVALDLEAEQGRQHLLRLLAHADLLLLDDGPDAPASLGLDDMAIEAVNPRMVITTISPFGASGPYRDYAATDLTVAALSGYLALTGEPDREPLKARGRMVGACVPGLYAAVASLAALHDRDRTGGGQRVEVAAMEAQLSTTRFYETTYAATGVLFRRAGGHLAFTFPCGLLPCKDGHITMVAGQDTWDLVCSIMGIADLAADPATQTAVGRAEQAERLTARMAEWLKDHTREECFHLFQELRVVTGMVCNAAEVVDLEQFHAREFFVDVEHPLHGRLRMPGAPARLSRTPWRTARPAPLLGEHDDRLQPAGAASPVEAPDARRSTRGAAASDPPLSGLRVLDLTTYMAGPFAAMALADLGAEVIKIEAIQRLDAWRGLAGSRVTDSAVADHPWERSSLFNAQHRNKLELTLNLNDPRGQQIFKDLVRKSDVVLENYTARVMLNFGLDYDVLKAVNPGIIMLSLNGLGASGPWKDYVSFAQVGESLGGIYAITGYADGHLVHHTPMPADPASGLTAATAVLAALRHRARTGEGQRIEVAQAEVIASLTADALMDYTVNGRIWGPAGNQDAEMAPHNVYPCRGEDEWIAVAVATDDQWRALVAAMGRPARTDNPCFATAAGRKEHEAEIDAALTAWTRGFVARDLMERLQAAGVPAGVVQGPRELLEDPHLRARAYWKSVDRAEVGVLPYPGPPMHFSRTPVDIRRPAPLLGEHNHQVLREIVGCTDAEIAALEHDQVIGTAPLVPA
jgi:crotonobetainyl-CoA:carnitine CoA-transferase CaiB-like acyl-CoA transferase